MSEKYPVKIIENPYDKIFKVSTSIEILNVAKNKIQEDLNYIEQDYTFMICAVRQLIEFVKREKRVNPRIYWLIGDNIVNFIDRLNDLGFYLLNQNRTIAMHIGISESSVKKFWLFGVDLKKFQ